MTRFDISHQRLYTQGISTASFKQAADVVQWLGAVQAQDYLGSLWAIGLRIKNAIEPDIEKAIADRKIVRSWPMRGTLHFVPAEDIHWMLKLLTPRVILRSEGLYNQAGLDKSTFAKCKKLLSKALRDGQQFTRKQIYEVFERSRISTTGQRGLHILGRLAQEGLICFGARKGRQHTFTLLDEWICSKETPEPDEALAKLAGKYFSGHGPATVHDFAWWSGLTLVAARRAISIIGTELQVAKMEGTTYWMKSNKEFTKPFKKSVFLLPPFDEYTVGYKDRDAVVDTGDGKPVHGYGIGLISASLIINSTNGKIAGIWKRSFIKNRVFIETETGSINNALKKRILTEARRYGRFVGMEVELKTNA